MGISIDQISYRYVNKVQQASSESKQVQKGDRNFDEILISANSRQIEEKKITEELAKKVLFEVKQETPQERIETLRQAVSEDNYRIDADAIVSRMLLEKGE